jgi:hypothetical protein
VVEVEGLLFTSFHPSSTILELLHSGDLRHVLGSTTSNGFKLTDYICEFESNGDITV